jgi:membrane peptidoglycan carboxypeptidase
LSFFRYFFRPKSKLFIKKRIPFFSPKEKKPKSVLKKIFWGTFFVGVFVGLLGVLYVGIVVANTPSLRIIETSNFAQSSMIYDRTGTVVLYTLHGEENRKNVSFSEVSEPMRKAILAAEDADFYAHPGVDLMGIVRSGIYAIRYGEARGGGSTITQQLIKNVQFSGNEKTFQQRLERKIQEVVLSWKLEKTYTKDHILELYLNRVPFGRNAYGVESAAEIYFGKKAKDLGIAESAFLAGLPQSPGVFSRRTNVEFALSMDSIQRLGIETYQEAVSLAPESIKRGVIGSEIPLANGKTDYFPGRFDYVLGQMLEKGFITKNEYDQALEESKTLQIIKNRVDIKEAHFVEYVRSVLEEEYDESFLEKGGLKIITTIDIDMQKKGKEILKEFADKNVEKYNAHNAALVAIDPHTGQVLVHIGSRDYFATELDGKKFDGNVDVITSFPGRQPGSTFKPIVYATAFEKKGLAPETILFDVQTNFGNGYIPQNFSGKFIGPVSVRRALGNSLNIPAIKAGVIAGIQNVYDTTISMGIPLSQNADFYGSAISLGVAEARPIEMAEAYAVFANKGVRVKANPILKIMDADGNVLMDFTNLEAPNEEDQVISSETAYLITNILSDPSARGEGWNSYLALRDGRTAAVKTGTSNKVVNGKKFASDGWTIGYTPQILTVVWTGNNDGSALSASASGFGSVAPIWQKFMNEVHTSLPKESFEIPEGIRNIKVAKFSGKLPSDGMDEKLLVNGIFSSKWLPQEIDDSFVIVEREKISKKLPNEFTPPDALEKVAVLNFHSYFPEMPNWESPVKKWVEQNGASIVAELGIPNVVEVAPTEITTRYTAETQSNAPEMRIVSPANYAIVSPPFINVDVDGQAKNGIEKMEFYWDDVFVDSKLTSPWVARINVGSAQNGTTHRIRVDTIDRLLYRNSTEIEVKIGEDTTPPEISILSPQPGQSVEIGSVITLSVSSLDRNSAVKRVSFEMDGKNLGSITKIPFEMVWKVPEEEGKHFLTVVSEDSSGNKAQQELEFFAKKTTSVNADFFGFLKPNNGDTVSGNVPITIVVPEKFKQTVISILYKNSSGVRETIATFNPSEIPMNGVLSALWRDAPKGEYDLYISARENDKSDFSQKVTVIRE